MRALHGGGKRRERKGRALNIQKEGKRKEGGQKRWQGRITTEDERNSPNTSKKNHQTDKNALKITKNH